MKKYRALLSQSGSGIPTEKILHNSIGAIVWTRREANGGMYIGTLEGAFPEGKTFPMIGQNGDYFASQPQVYTFHIHRVDDNTVEIQCVVLDIEDEQPFNSDDLLKDTPVEILVYP